ncbi:uncharacterized protein J3D65DRAFT_19987 [Phyllosticta citribraziliensis]|uniref:Uncharacterized protein n=1 Tax=Phyllosticta citribraziliensis TaxID=989973 RepID=A0ABR1M979_9PEZI
MPPGRSKAWVTPGWPAGRPGGLTCAYTIDDARTHHAMPCRLLTRFDAWRPFLRNVIPLLASPLCRRRFKRYEVMPDTTSPSTLSLETRIPTQRPTRYLQESKGLFCCVSWRTNVSISQTQRKETMAQSSLCLKTSAAEHAAPSSMYLISSLSTYCALYHRRRRLPPYLRYFHVSLPVPHLPCPAQTGIKKHIKTVAVVILLKQKSLRLLFPPMPHRTFENFQNTPPL